MKTIIALIAVLVVIGGGWWMLKQNNVDEVSDLPINTSGNTSGTVVNEPASTSSSTPTVGTVREFTVTGSNFAFNPKTMTVNKGDTVKVTFVNSGGIHDFVIDEFNARTAKINGGQTAVVTFVADKTGTFEYYCSVGTHRQMGMVGTLTVK